MPQLEKGGKWVFGWVVVQDKKKIVMPPEACQEYGFRVGDQIAFTKGSRSSGGFGIGRAEILPLLLKKRVTAYGKIYVEGRVLLPPQIEAHRGNRLLAVRGSGYALGFITKGPVFELALKHHDLAIF